MMKINYKKTINYLIVKQKKKSRKFLHAKKIFSIHFFESTQHSGLNVIKFEGDWNSNVVNRVNCSFEKCKSNIE